MLDDITFKRRCDDNMVSVIFRGLEFSFKHGCNSVAVTSRYGLGATLHGDEKLRSEHHRIMTEGDLINVTMQDIVLLYNSKTNVLEAKCRPLVAKLK